MHNSINRNIPLTHNHNADRVCLSVISCSPNLAEIKKNARANVNPGLYFERKSTPYTQTILRTWGAYSRPPMPIYAVVIAQMASINTPTTRRLLL